MRQTATNCCDDTPGYAASDVAALDAGYDELMGFFAGYDVLLEEMGVLLRQERWAEGFLGRYDAGYGGVALVPGS